MNRTLLEMENPVQNWLGFWSFKNTEHTVSTNIYDLLTLGSLYFLSRSWWAKSAGPFSFPLVKEVKQLLWMLFLTGPGGDSCQMWDTSCKLGKDKDPHSCNDFYKAEMETKGSKPTLSLPKRVTLNSVQQPYVPAPGLDTRAKNMKKVSHKGPRSQQMADATWHNKDHTNNVCLQWQDPRGRGRIIPLWMKELDEAHSEVTLELGFEG